MSTLQSHPITYRIEYSENGLSGQIIATDRRDNSERIILWTGRMDLYNEIFNLMKKDCYNISY